MPELISQINHKFISKDFYFPTWEINTLILGTFNPVCGEETDYYYGRRYNNFWRTIERTNNFDDYYFQDDLNRKLKFMEENKFGCIDVVKSIQIQNNNCLEKICGKGYSDQILFTQKVCCPQYCFGEIENYLKTQNVKKVLFTWGKRNKPLIFKQEIIKFKSFCVSQDIHFVEACPTVSGRFRGAGYKKILDEFYSKHI